MKSKEKCEDNITQLNILSNKLDNIEELLKISIVNNLLDNLGIPLSDLGTDNPYIERCREVIDNAIIKDFSLNKYDVYLVGNSKIVMLQINHNISIKKLRQVNEIIGKKLLITPVFVFEKLNGMTKKKMEQEQIAYYIIGKELHIHF